MDLNEPYKMLGKNIPSNSATSTYLSGWYLVSYFVSAKPILHLDFLPSDAVTITINSEWSFLYLAYGLK